MSIELGRGCSRTDHKIIREAVKFAKGKFKPKSVYFVLTPADIKAIRQGTNMSQAVFAQTFQLSPDTIKGWKQGKRKPDAAATQSNRCRKKMDCFVS